MSTFEELDIWRESIVLGINIFKETEKFKSQVLKEQMIRSSMLIPSNIAEGHGRNSVNDFIIFLNMANGLCSELKSQLYFCKETGVIEKGKCQEYIDETRKISEMINKFIQSLNNRNNNMISLSSFGAIYIN